MLCATPRPLVIAHRGFSAAAPENTLPAFELALAVESDLIELDVHQTQDGQLVVIHDATLDRTTDAQKRWGRKHVSVGSVTAAALAELDAGAWFHPRYSGTRIPTLHDALRTISSRGGRTLIERKTGNPASFTQLLRALNLMDQVVVQSFDWSFLRSLRRIEPQLLLGALGPPDLLPDGTQPDKLARTLHSTWIELAQETGATILIWNHRHLHAQSTAEVQSRGLKLWVYTVNEPADFETALHRGVNGIITDQPARLWRYLALRTNPHTQPAK